MTVGPLHRLGAAADVWWARDLARQAPRPPDVRVIALRRSFVRYLDTAPGDGVAPMVVLLADPPVTVESYGEVVRLLREKHRVVVCELPGFGFSAPRWGFDFRFGPVNDVIAEFIGGLGGGPTTLVAPCGAAYCALDIATRYSGLVERVVLSQAPGWADEMAWRDARDRASKGMLSVPVGGQVVLRVVRRQRGREWLRWVCATPAIRDRLLADVEETMRAGALFSLASMFQQYLTGDAPAVSPSADVVALWGGADPSHRASDPASIRELAPAARIVLLPDAGHFPELECPGELVRVLD